MNNSTRPEGRYEGRPDGIDLAARSRARRRALQALYAKTISGNSLEQVIAHFRDEQDMSIADLDYFESLVRGVTTHQSETGRRPQTAFGSRHRSGRSN